MVIASKTGREDLGKCPATTSPARWWLTSTDPRSLSIAIEYSIAVQKQSEAIGERERRSELSQFFVTVTETVWRLS